MSLGLRQILNCDALVWHLMSKACAVCLPFGVRLHSEKGVIYRMLALSATPGSDMHKVQDVRTIQSCLWSAQLTLIPGGCMCTLRVCMVANVDAEPRLEFQGSKSHLNRLLLT